MTTCSRCGGMVIREGDRFVCYNDACPLNAEMLRARDPEESAAVAIGWAMRTMVLALVVGAAYGLWLLVRP